MKFNVRGSSSRRRKRRKAHSELKAVAISEERNWLDLPRDVVCKIFLKLGPVKILTRVPEVCTVWRNISKDPFLWRTINMCNPDSRDYEHIYESLCRRAVDYSSGHLVSINIEQFATDDLLRHIADSARHLRRLRLAGCYSLSDDGFCEIAEKFSQLEEVDISIGSLGEHAIEAIGRCCPQLKSFKFNMEAYSEPHFECDEGAFAIAKTMPGLRHLQLFGNEMTNAGLLAILDGCPRLESLDIRQCFNLDLGGSLGRRCAKQIKDLRLSNNPTDDFPFEAGSDYGSPDADYPSGISDIISLLGDDVDYFDDDDSDFYDSYDDESDSYDDESDYYHDDDDDDDDDSDHYEFSGGSESSEYDHDTDFDFSSSHTRSLLSLETDYARKMMQQGPGMAPPSMRLQPPQQYQQPPYVMMLPQPQALPPMWGPSAQPPPPQLASADEVRTLWIGNLQYWMDKNYLYTCFAHTGEVTSVKVIRNKQTSQSEGYGFIEFNSHAAAERVLLTYNGAFMPNGGQSFRLNWATFSAGKRSRHDDSPDYTIFVGDLAADVTDYLLQETFRTRYNSVKGAKVVIDRFTGRSKGYGFVRFADESEQMRAMTEMQGVLCSTRPMRIGPAINKNPAATQSQPEASYQSSQGSLNENDPNNTTIFVGNLNPNVADDNLRQVFSQYGEVVHVKIPAGKRYGFVQFVDRSCAEEALRILNGALLGGQNVRLSWGRSYSNKQAQPDPNR